MSVSAISSTPSGFAASSLRGPAGQRAPATAGTPESAPVSSTPAKAEDSNTTTPAANSAQDSVNLSKEALDQLAKLKARDAVVRQHEAAHMAAAGGMVTSAASFTYQKGPDGASYAIGGEVGIDTSPGRTPKETIERASKIQAAALAPADPSGQDLAVAAKAQQMAMQARSELAQQSRANATATSDSGGMLSKAYGSEESSQRISLSVFA